MQRIYLDYAATTPVDEEVFKKMKPFFTEKFGNSSSLHSFGQEALFAMDEAREKIAEFLGCKRKEILFLSSATEANNLAVLGILQTEEKPHVILPPFEHKAVLEPIKKSGVEVSYLSVSKEGLIRADEVKELIKENTVLVSVGYVNSEVGMIQPVKEIGEIIKEKNKQRKRKIFFHTDAVQAANYLSCNVEELGVDLLTISGHKIYGPKGSAVLYKREGVKLSPLFYGAGQEKGMKPGTENIAAVVGLGIAVEKIKENKIEKTKVFRDRIIDDVFSKIPGTKLNGSKEKRIANNINFTFDGAEGESIMIALDREGIAVSTGSACASGSLEPSYVLLSMGLSHREAHGSLRVSLGRFTTDEEVDYFLEKLPPIISKLRKISGK